LKELGGRGQLSAALRAGLEGCILNAHADQPPSATAPGADTSRGHSLAPLVYPITRTAAA
jgi:hypothetical protein